MALSTEVLPQRTNRASDGVFDIRSKTRHFVEHSEFYLGRQETAGHAGVSRFLDYEQGNQRKSSVTKVWHVTLWSSIVKQSGKGGFRIALVKELLTISSYRWLPVRHPMPRVWNAVCQLLLILVLYLLHATDRTLFRLLDEIEVTEIPIRR